MQTDIPPTDNSSGDVPEPVRPRRRAILAGAVLLALALGSTAVVLELAADGTPAEADAVAERVGPEAVDGDAILDTDVPTGGGMALCAVARTPETLVEREVAFVGTVTVIAGDDVTFEVEEAFRGELDATVTLGGAEFLATPNPDNVNPITVGGRYLVAGDGGFAWGCGFTHLYDEDVATTWRTAFAG